MLDTSTNEYLKEKDNSFAFSFIFPKKKLENPDHAIKELLKLPDVIQPDLVEGFDVDIYYGFKFEYNTPRKEFEGLTVRQAFEKIHYNIKKHTDLGLNLKWMK